MPDTTPRLFQQVRGTVASLAVMLASGAFAQTYFYLDQISVTPSTPTTSDDITITVHGSLSSTASYIVGTGFNVVGNTVQINVDAGNQGIGLDVLVPHSEDISIGNLAAGTYTIAISGSFTSDMAPAPQHQFVVSGGTPTDCDSVEIIGARWGVFNSDRIVVTVANNSSDGFDYPGFVLLDAEGDTIAKETVDYFEITPFPQEHVLYLMPGVDIDGNSVSGQLHLWSGFYTEQECEWSVSWELCPEAACVDVQPFLINMGNSIVDADIPYVLANSDGLELLTGTFSIGDAIQSDYETAVCLPPGDYTLSLQPGVFGGQLYHGMTTSLTGQEQVQALYVQGNTPNTMPFAVFAECIDSGNGLEPLLEPGQLSVRAENDRLMIGVPAGSSIGTYRLWDIHGRMVRSGTINADRGEITMSGTSSGLYVLSCGDHAPARFVR